MGWVRLFVRDERGRILTSALSFRLVDLRADRELSPAFRPRRDDRKYIVLKFGSKAGCFALTVQAKNYFEQTVEFELKTDEAIQLELALKSRWEIPSLADLPRKQKTLVSGYLSALNSEWPDLPEPEQTTFLAVTHALDQLRIDGGSSTLDLVKSLEKVVGDPSRELKGHQVFRLFVALNEGFRRWINSGAKYTDRKGRVQGTVAAPGHPGYPKSRKTKDGRPNLQWSFSKDFQKGDLDLDGKPFLAHLTRENSDVREFYEEYKRKFGNPGFAHR